MLDTEVSNITNEQYFDSLVDTLNRNHEQTLAQARALKETLLLLGIAGEKYSEFSPTLLFFNIPPEIHLYCFGPRGAENAARLLDRIESNPKFISPPEVSRRSSDMVSLTLDSTFGTRVHVVVGISNIQQWLARALLLQTRIPSLSVAEAFMAALNKERLYD